MEKVYVINGKQLVVFPLKDSLILKIDKVYTVVADDTYDTAINTYMKIFKTQISSDHIELCRNINPIVFNADSSNIFNLSTEYES